MNVKLDDEIVKARRALEQSYGSETEGLLKVLDQLEAQMADAIWTQSPAAASSRSRHWDTRARRSRMPRGRWSTSVRRWKS